MYIRIGKAAIIAIYVYIYLFFVFAIVVTIKHVSLATLNSKTENDNLLETNGIL